MQTVRTIIEYLQGFPEDTPVIIRDEIEILRSGDGKTAKKGLYNNFGMTQWYERRPGDEEGEGPEKDEAGRVDRETIAVSFNINDDEYLKKLTDGN